MRAPPELRFVLATRHDLRLGLHRLTRHQQGFPDSRPSGIPLTRNRHGWDGGPPAFV